MTTGTGHSPCYLFETADPAERRRLDAHAQLWDPFTFRKLAETGVGDGWRCLEIGAGTGTVAAWLAGRVGATGLVVATDIETRWLEPVAGTNLEVRRHDVAAEPIHGDGYNLIHARLVLEHLPHHPTLVTKLVTALQPGGWLVAEDYDVRTMALTEPPQAAWSSVTDAVVQAMRAAGSDPLHGSRLLTLLRDAGLTDITAEGVVHSMPIPDLAPVFRPALERLRPALLRSGTVTADQLDATLRAYDDRDHPTTAFTPILVAASGRRPIEHHVG